MGGKRAARTMFALGCGNDNVWHCGYPAGAIPLPDTIQEQRGRRTALVKQVEIQTETLPGCASRDAEIANRPCCAIEYDIVEERGGKQHAENLRVAKGWRTALAPSPVRVLRQVGTDQKARGGHPDEDWDYQDQAFVHAER
jgi:hypothetical protein